MKGRRQFTSEEAKEIRSLLAEKLRADHGKQKTIRGKIRRDFGFFISDFSDSGAFGPLDFDDLVRNGQITITGSGERFPAPSATVVTPPPPIRANNPEYGSGDRQGAGRAASDEAYVIDLCDEVLGCAAMRQYRFPFLAGDSGTPLPVDAYYPDLKLVVEYRERQHTEPVKFFDRRQTVSGVSRGEQRRMYDQRRRDVLPQHGIRLVEIGVEDLCHNGSKRLHRNRQGDKKVIAGLLGLIGETV